jgi:hypothetical protein
MSDQLPAIQQRFFGLNETNNQIILDVIYNASLTAEVYFADIFLGGDLNRVVYASNSDAFRRRKEDLNRRRETTSGLKFPFFSYKLLRTDAGNRDYWNHRMYVDGIYDEELEGKLLFRPITLVYEATFWSYGLNDAQIAFSEAQWDADNTTLLRPVFNITNQVNNVTKPTPLFAHLNYEPVFAQEFDYQNWREQGKIHNFTFDFELETVMIKSNFDVSIPDNIIIDYVKRFSNDEVQEEDSYRFLINRFDETVEDI